MDFNKIEEILEEINRAKQAYQYLEDIFVYLSPYDKKINGKDCGNLCYKVADFLGFDDSE